MYIRRRDIKNRKDNLRLEKTVLTRTKELREEKNNVELQNIEIVSQKRDLEIVIPEHQKEIRHLMSEIQSRRSNRNLM